MSNKFFQLLYLLFLTGTMFAPKPFTQSSEYRYLRSINSAQSGWNKAIVPMNAFHKMNIGFSDVRLIGVKGKDTIEIPYLIRKRESKAITQKYTFDWLDEVRSGENWYYTFKLREKKEINHIVLCTSRKDFDWQVTTEGSNDNENWKLIVDNYRLVAFSGEDTSFYYTTIKFGTCSFRYYRVTIKTLKLPKIETAYLEYRSVDSIEPAKVDGVVMRSRENAKTNQTLVNMKLPYKVPVEKLLVSFEPGQDFVRPFLLKYVSDSLKTPKGYMKESSELLWANIDSRNTNTFYLNGVIADELSLIISNGDNAPVKISGVTFYADQYDVFFKNPDGHALHLIYGNRNVQSPNYDLAYFASNIPDSANIAVMEDEKDKRPEIADGSNLELWKYALYAVLSIGVVILVFVARKMLRPADEENPST